MNRDLKSVKLATVKYWNKFTYSEKLPKFQGKIPRRVKNTSDSARIVCNTYVFINSNLFILQKLKVELKISNTTHVLLPRVKVLFLPKNTDFLQKKC